MWLLVCDEPNVAVTGDSRVSRVQHAMLNMHANMLMHAKRDNTKRRAITGKSMCDVKAM